MRVLRMYYWRVTITFMDKTITVRLAKSQDEALTKRAKALGQTRSEVVRELIDKGLEEQPFGRTIGHLKGRLELTAAKSGWRRHIKDRNWR
jgi:Ribbon-helix-helix protein, copG family